MRSTQTRVLVDRAPSGEWSALENVRHLLFAEQLHLGKFLPERPSWSALGLAPHFLSGEIAFREVGSKATTYVDEVLDAWDAVHAPVRALLSDANDEMCRALEGNLKHLLFHVAIIESLIRQSP